MAAPTNLFSPFDPVYLQKCLSREGRGEVFTLKLKESNSELEKLSHQCSDTKIKIIELKDRLKQEGCLFTQQMTKTLLMKNMGKQVALEFLKEGVKDLLTLHSCIAREILKIDKEGGVLERSDMRTLEALKNHLTRLNKETTERCLSKGLSMRTIFDNAKTELAEARRQNKSKVEINLILLKIKNHKSFIVKLSKWQIIINLRFLSTAILYEEASKGLLRRN